MHLHTAEQIRTAVSNNRAQYGRLADCLTRAWPAFYLGNVAPDVQNLNGMAREATHFYHLAQDRAGLPAYDEMLAQYPELARPEQMELDQALFVVGYRAHLLFDLIWWRKVAGPHFFWSETFADLPQRRLAHFVLLAYLDAQALAALPETAAETLAAARPSDWLPFVPDADLRRWRDMLVDQLVPGALSQTTAVYAARLGMPPARLAHNLQDAGWLASHLFDKVPLVEVEASLETAVTASINLIEAYLVHKDMK
jgi:hypothetical protein